MNKFNSKFNKIYESVINKLRSFDNYDFKKNEDDSISCSFFLNRDSKKYNVKATYSNNKFIFSIIDEFGNNLEMTEKEFATKYYKDFDNFKEAFTSYITNNDIDSNTEINQFSEVLKKQYVQNPEVIKEKEFDIDGMIFVFKMLKDLAVDNYCECQFQIPDEETEELIYYKALIAIKEKNSVIIKIVKFNEKGDVIETIMPSDLMKFNPNEYKKLFKAIKKMEKYISSITEL